MRSIMILAGLVLLFGQEPLLFAGKVDLTTYYPAPYGEYQELKTTGDAYFATTSGNVGIGTTTPINTLEVVGKINAGPHAQTTYTGTNTSLGVRFYSKGANASLPNYMHPAGRIYGSNLSNSWSNQALVFGAANGWGSSATGGEASYNDSLMLLGDGRVWIGTNYPMCTLGGTVALSVGGDLYVGNNARKPTGVDWINTSDRRIKTDIESIDSAKALDTINRLRPVKYRYTEEYLSKHPEIKDTDYYSFIAQEYKEVWPDSVSEGEDGLLMMDTSNTTFHLVSAVQELAKEVKELKKESLEMKKELAELKKKNK